MPDKGGIQLLPETRKSIEVRTPGENRMLGMGFLVAAIVGGLYFGVTMYVGSLDEKIAEIESQIRNLEEQRDKKTEADLIGLANQTAIVGGVLRDHIFTTQAIDKLESLLRPDILVSNAEISPLKELVTFQVDTVSYTALAKQIAAFYSDPDVRDVELGKIEQGDPGRLKATFILKLNIDKFFKKK